MTGPVTLWGRIAAGPERDLQISQIEVKDRLRGVGEGAVSDLAVSISEVGMIQPIVVRSVATEDGEIALRLVAGAHRLEACKRLGHQVIRARVVTVSDLDARQIEIDENLIRSDSGGWERISFLGERAEIYADRHPEAVVPLVAEGPRGRGRPRRDLFLLRENNGVQRHIPAVMGFLSEVADETGLARKTLYRDAQIWAALRPYRAEISALPIRSDLGALRQLAGIADQDERRQVVEVLVSGGAKNVSEAIALAAGNTLLKPAHTPIDVWMKEFKRTVKSAPPGGMDVALHWLSGQHLPNGWTIGPGDVDA